MGTREIPNPFTEMEGFNCFACGPNNRHGLRMTFYADEEAGEVFSRVEPVEDHAGYPGILHGGIQATLLDEVAFWAVWDKVGKAALTSRMEIAFRRPVAMSEEVEARARVMDVKRRRATVETWLLVEGKTKTRATIVYYLVDPPEWKDLSEKETERAIV